MVEELFDVFAGIGHDLRNPLSTIVMGAEHLARTAPDDRTARAATQIAASAERIANLIDLLVEVSNLRRDERELSRARTDLAALWQRAIDGLRFAHPDAAIAVAVAGDATGAWDGERLVRAASCLVHDAIAHGTPGSPIDVRVDGSAAATVTASIHHRGAGLGLGLYVARHIIVAHGGTVSVASNELDGTTVRVELPR